MKYKKGQIVPRFLIRCKNRKTQHLWKFGADVEIIGRKIIAKSEGEVIVRERCYIGGKKGKPRIYDRATPKGIHIQGVDFAIKAHLTRAFNLLMA
jgi:hypothetical protein